MMDNAVFAEGITLNDEIITVIEVFVDDFIGMTSGSTEKTFVTRFSCNAARHIFHRPTTSNIWT